MSGYADRTLSGMRWSTGGLWYQFMTTNGYVVTTPYNGLFYTQGSSVAVKLPKIDKETDQVDWNTVKVFATGSFLESLPTDPPIPPLESYQDSVQRVPVPLQIQFITEPVYYYHSDLSKPERYKQLLTSWASIQGSIYNAGAFMLGQQGRVTDIGYDVAPTTIKGRLVNVQSPNTDWPHDACQVNVQHEEFGSRIFIVLVDASSRFYCWPLLNSDLKVNQESGYTEQWQIINIPEGCVQSMEVPFPAWVHVPVGDRRDTDWTVNSGEPRYTWRFHPQGTKVVGVVLNREDFSGHVYGRTLTTYTDRPFRQVDLGQATYKKEDDYGITYTGKMKIDLPGYVEFSLDISLTGVELTDFTFDMTLLREQEANETFYPVAADYLSPSVGILESVDGVAGDLVVLNLNCYYTEGVAEEGQSTTKETLIQRHCGYLDQCNHYMLQSTLDVVNIENDTVLKTFFTKSEHPDYQIHQYHKGYDDFEVYSGCLLSCDLAKLSFVYKIEKQVFTIDEEAYFSNSSLDVFQRWKAVETGVRYVVFGNTVFQESYGQNLGLWSSVDALALLPNVVRFDPTKTGTRFLTSHNTSINSPHWLVNDFKDVVIIKDSEY